MATPQFRFWQTANAIDLDRGRRLDVPAPARPGLARGVARASPSHESHARHVLVRRSSPSLSTSRLASENTAKASRRGVSISRLIRVRVSHRPSSTTIKRGLAIRGLILPFPVSRHNNDVAASLLSSSFSRLQSACSTRATTCQPVESTAHFVRGMHRHPRQSRMPATTAERCSPHQEP